MLAHAEDVEALRGEVELPIPPASAVKIDGERAYRLHRRGVAVEMPTRRSTIHELEILRYEPPSLALELARLERHLRPRDCRRARRPLPALRRTAVGPFRVEDADDGARPARRSRPCRTSRAAS